MTYETKFKIGDFVLPRRGNGRTSYVVPIIHVVVGVEIQVAGIVSYVLREAPFEDLPTRLDVRKAEHSLVPATPEAIREACDALAERMIAFTKAVKEEE